MEGKLSKAVSRVDKVTDKPYDLNGFFGMYHHPELRANYWFPPKAWINVKNMVNTDNASRIVFDPTDTPYTVYTSPQTNGRSYCVMLNSLKPFNLWTDSNIDTVYGHKTAPLDYISLFYHRARVTSAAVTVDFRVRGDTITSATDETLYWYSKIRLGCFLGASPNAWASWSDTSNQVEAEARISEAVRAGLLNTVPLIVSNDPVHIKNRARLVLPRTNIMDQFESTEAIDELDPYRFSLLLHNYGAGETQDDMDNQAQENLYLHFFCMVEDPADGTSGTTLDSLVAVQAEVHIDQHVQFTQPRIKPVEEDAAV